jgi:hypothetical protein
MQIERWTEMIVADLTRRGLPHVEPLVRALARSTAALRAADWNDDAGGSRDEGSPVARRPTAP